MDVTGANLKEFREGKGWSQPELGRMIGVGRSRISQLEGKGKLSLKVVEKIAAAADVPIEEITQIEKFNPRPARRWRIFLIVAAVVLVAIIVMSQFFADDIIPQVVTTPEFDTLYKTFPGGMLKEKLTAFALFQKLTPVQKLQIPEALKNYQLRWQKDIDTGFGCKDKNFLIPGPVPCGFENYLTTGN